MEAMVAQLAQLPPPRGRYATARWPPATSAGVATERWLVATRSWSSKDRFRTVRNGLTVQEVF